MNDHQEPSVLGEGEQFKVTRCSVCKMINPYSSDVSIKQCVSGEGHGPIETVEVMPVEHEATVERLRQELADVRDRHDAESEAAEKHETRASQAEAALEKTEVERKRYREALEKAERGLSKARDGLDRALGCAFDLEYEPGPRATQPRSKLQERYAEEAREAHREAKAALRGETP